MKSRTLPLKNISIKTIKFSRMDFSQCCLYYLAFYNSRKWGHLGSGPCMAQCARWAGGNGPNASDDLVLS